MLVRRRKVHVGRLRRRPLHRPHRHRLPRVSEDPKVNLAVKVCGAFPHTLMLLALLSAGERREEGGAATKRRRRSPTKSASSSSSACASAAADPAQSDSAEDNDGSGSENKLSGQRSDEDKSEEDKSEAEGEDSNSEDELSSSGSAASVESDKMVRRVSTAEMRRSKKIHDQLHLLTQSSPVPQQLRSVHNRYDAHFISHHPDRHNDPPIP